MRLKKFKCWIGFPDKNVKKHVLHWLCTFSLFFQQKRYFKGSHYFTRILTVFHKMLPIERRKENHEMELALSTNAEQESPFLTMNAKCLNTFFDYLSLADLCAIGRTCKRLRRIAGKYFAKNFPLEYIRLRQTRNGEMKREIGDCKTNFTRYARRLHMNSDNIDLYRYAATKKFRSLDTILFSGHVFTNDHYSCIVQMNILAQVSTLNVSHCSAAFRDGLLNRILKSCTNLTNLIIKFDFNENSASRWQHQHCSTLERLSVLQHSHVNVNKFLQANPQLKKLSFPVVPALLPMIKKTGMKLDYLEYVASNYVSTKMLTINKKTRREIINLHEQGHIENMQVLFECDADEYSGQRMDELGDVSFFTFAKISCAGFGSCPAHKVEMLASMVNLTKLHFCASGIDLLEAEDLSEALVNLEEIQHRSLYEMIPFARQLPKLRVIKAWTLSHDFEDAFIDLEALNNDRMQLPDAEVLKIYLDDKAYHHVRWTSIKLFYEFVEVRRFNLIDDDCY